MRELQHAVRRLRESPMFTIAAILTMAIAIGATASVFGLVDGVLLKAFPYRAPDRVLTIGKNRPRTRALGLGGVASAANYLDWRAQSRAFTSLAAAKDAAFTVTGTHEAERVSGLVVTPNYFPALGITPVLGRPFAPDSAGPAEVVISYGYWQGRFGGTPSVLGQSLVLNDSLYTIVGVMPAGVPGDVELWTRLSFTGADEINRGWSWLRVYGRLKPGVTRGGAQADLETIQHRVALTYPVEKSWSVETRPFLDELVGEVRPALVMLLAAAACVLLIGATNLANLFLVRCLAREREMAVRSALGATRRRLVGELVIEAATLGTIAGALGVAAAVAGVRILRALAPPTFPRLSQVGVDYRVVAFCTLVSMATVFVFGVLPAWHTSRGNLAGYLKEGARGTHSAHRLRLQDVFAVTQVAVALVLLTGAGLLVKSFEHFRRLDLGVRPDGVLTARINLSALRYPTPERQAAFVGRVVEELAALPGIDAASGSSLLPGVSNIHGFVIVGDPGPDSTHEGNAYLNPVTPDYFRTMGITLRRGRGILPSDDRRARKIAIVDERLARQAFPARDPIGQRLAFGSGPPWEVDTAMIVGVVTSVQQGGLLDHLGLGMFYVPFAQVPTSFASVAVHTLGAPEAQTASVRHAISSLDRSVPVFEVQTLGGRLAEDVDLTRFSTFLTSLFALIALVLGVVGIYSVLTCVVGQRRREIAVRLALGATPSRVMRTVIWQACALTGTGIVIGSAAAWMLTRVLANLFLGVSPHDPAIFVSAAFLFALVALVAASVPAFRTTRVNPVAALNST